MEHSSKMIEEEAPSISHTVASVTDLPIPSQKSARDSQQKPCPKTPPVLRRPSRIKHRPQDDIEVQSLLQGVDVMRQDLEDTNAEYLARLSLQKQPHSVHLAELPVEVQDCVIDHLAGHLVGTAPSSVTAPRGFRNWSTAMRHPRRKQLSDLALLSKTWRELIQERLYRHSMLNTSGKAPLVYSVDMGLQSKLKALVQALLNAETGSPSTVISVLMSVISRFGFQCGRSKPADVRQIFRQSHHHSRIDLT